MYKIKISRFECFMFGNVYTLYFYCRNPYDIPRKNLLDQVTRMRKNLLQTSHMAQTLMEQGL